MARRSYLSRIAQPLSGGDPVVWSTPRASADEARPTAQGRPSATPGASADARPVASVVEKILADRAPRLPAPSRLDEPGRQEGGRQEGGRPEREQPETGQPQIRLEDAALEPATSARHPLTVEALDTRPPAKAVDRSSAPEGLAAQVEHADSAAAPDPWTPSIPRPDTFARPPAPSGADIQVRANGEPPPAALRPADTAPHWRDAGPRDDHVGMGPPEPSGRAPRPAEPAPRLHIGAIEIRVTQPPPPAAATAPAPIIVRAAPAASAPLARAYASRFGLAQG